MYTLNQFISNFNKMNPNKISLEGLKLIYNDIIDLYDDEEEGQKYLSDPVAIRSDYNEYSNYIEAIDDMGIEIDVWDSESEILEQLQEHGHFVYNDNAFVIVAY